ncbi:hypothetical protein [Clavibacter nebraskensis]|jgi:hypothetical protein|uniref:Uncharacterized protein n=1 Tax=Clavibacter nebraskensis TaxID=31963 RepID=A0A399PGN9_9MICO|nr:hypothetical protein [Clavibacter nebraskensis]KXU21852.1 hypothetical protein VV38_00485 [Clavibacter nebraskensis]OAH18893.1 hypothetical protein A3Q38_10755 [Clavibacter nebraskensis]QGV65531.1 hypothetical protein EGX36_00810 [Clavibacter nebraskensis]QGV68329.1 hypothetical protein EGX37_00810 [Clavibacter nebraskensis]QGV71122.1 hypothetical protein EGX35_00810 [Clavibacter nebraskensis]
MADAVETALLVLSVVGLVGVMVCFVWMTAHGMVDNRRPTRPMLVTGFACAFVGWGAMLIRLFLF